MHTLALQLAPVLAAEKSKVPFYIAGGLLVVWALTLSLGLGMRRPDFPGSFAGQRAVMAVTAVLVLGAVSTAVLTSSAPRQERGAAPRTEAQAPVPVVSAPVPRLGERRANRRRPRDADRRRSSPAPGKAGSSLSLAANPDAACSRTTPSS